MLKHTGKSLYSRSQQSSECAHYQPRVKPSHHDEDELLMGYELREKDKGENHEIRTTLLEIKAGVDLKAVSESLNLVFLPVFRFRFKPPQTPLLKN